MISSENPKIMPLHLVEMSNSNENWKYLQGLLAFVLDISAEITGLLYVIFSSPMECQEFTAGCLV